MHNTNWKKEIHLFVIIFLGIMLVTFFALNYRAFFQQIKYQRAGPAPIEKPILELGRTTGAIDITPYTQEAENK